MGSRSVLTVMALSKLLCITISTTIVYDNSFGVYAKHHRRAPKTLVFEVDGGVVVGSGVPQAARCHSDSLVLHLPNSHLHHYLVPATTQADIVVVVVIVVFALKIAFSTLRCMYLGGEHVQAGRT